TVSTLMEAGVDVIILGSNGYSYNGSDSTQGGTSGTGKSDVLLELADLGYSTDEVPLVMDSNTISVQIGTNGYNYSPITPMFVPYVQVYAYMEELEEVSDGLINPAAMVEFMFNELCHVSDDESRNVALYYIGTNWDAVDDEYDTVPDIENYVYDEDAIIEAINVGIQYALSGEAEENGNTLLAAYRTSENAYVILTEYLETEMDLENYTSSDYISLADTGDALGGGVGTIYYLNTTALYNAATTGNGSDMGSNESGGTSQFENVDTSFAQIITYYNSGEYGYGDDLQATLQNYLSHMVEHVWDPSELLSVEGTYGYESSSDGSTDSGSTHVHEYTSEVTLAATRYTEGVMTYTCTCGDSYTVAIPVLTDATFLFDDVTDESSLWYYDEVYWAYDLGITVGYTDKTFQPNNSCTRAEFAQFIYKLAEAYGLDDMTLDGEENPFSDVAETNSSGNEMWYYATIMWAYENGIVVGYTDGTFQPNEAVTRAESIQMLYNFYVNFVNGGEVPEVDAENTFSDVANVWYYDAIMWSVDSGLVVGYSDGTCRPNIDCNRAVMARLLYCTGTEILNPLYGVSTEAE
ncbi:MAG: S-layer homology domain-containing protein, partial [Oscillospiraceae bacterium]|nr:S-layer homology domain-containing protein [Oscillospiraceae bacterium]